MWQMVGGTCQVFGGRWQGVGGWRGWEEVAECGRWEVENGSGWQGMAGVACSIHISSPVPFLFPFSHFLFFLCHIFRFQI
jgi:hypothetical protein